VPEDPTPQHDAVAGGSAADKIFARVGDLDDFLRGLDRLGTPLPSRVNADEGNVERGLAKLVLTLVDLVRLVEKRDVRRGDYVGLAW
jgi:hypothetical protein